MALVKLDFFSETLGVCNSLYAILPQKSTMGQIGVSSSTKSGKFKSLLLLHGLSDDESIWLRRTSIERYADLYGIAVIMPRAERSFYCDMKYGGKYYTFIAKEVLNVAREFFNISDKREDTFVAGLSMGGYGALKIGLRENESFCAAAGLSSLTDIRASVNDDLFKKDLISVFGEELKINDEDDLFELVKMKSVEKLKPRIYMACGKNDFLYKDNIKLKNHIESFNYDFTYKEAVGTHNWLFWDKFIQDVLKWMLP